MLFIWEMIKKEFDYLKNMMMNLQMYLESQEAIPTSFENEVVNWMPDNNTHNQGQVYVGSDSLVSLRYALLWAETINRERFVFHDSYWSEIWKSSYQRSNLVSTLRVEDEVLTSWLATRLSPVWSGINSWPLHSPRMWVLTLWACRYFLGPSPQAP